MQNQRIQTPPQVSKPYQVRKIRHIVNKSDNFTIRCELIAVTLSNSAKCQVMAKQRTGSGI